MKPEGTYKITKIKHMEDSPVESAEDAKAYWDAKGEYSPNIGYWLIGSFLGHLKAGDSMLVLRTIRNGVKMPGIFTSSQIQEIYKLADLEDAYVITTKNSIYCAEKQ